jgi:Protein of unknwon function (DUF3310)
MDDVVNSPSHYKRGGIECIDAIRAMLTPEEFRGYLKGNILKYLWRVEAKGNPAQDSSKANVYLAWLREVYSAQ